MFRINPFAKKNSQSITEVTETNTESLSADQKIWMDSLLRWQMVAENNPLDVEARIHLIEAYQNLDQPKKAEQITLALLKDSSEHFLVKTLAAKRLMNEGKTSEARASWQAMTEQYPNQSEPMLQLAGLELKESNFSEVIRLTDAVLQTDPENIKCLILKARTAQKKECWQEAIDYWQQVLERKTKHYEAEMQQIHCLTRLGEPELAMDKVEASIARHPNATSFRFSRLKLLAKLDREEEAMQLVNEMLAADPDDHLTMFEKAKLLYSSDNIEEAENLCKNVLEKDPGDLKVLTLYARIGQKRVNVTNAA